MKRSYYFLMALAALCASPVFTSCEDENEDKGSTYDEWKKGQEGGEGGESGEPGFYIREVEDVKDTRIFPAAGEHEIYKPSQGNRFYKPIIVQRYGGSEPRGAWTDEKTRIVHYMEGYETAFKTYEKYSKWTNKWGSTYTKKKVDATGRFRVEKIDGRWWIIDPEGYLHYERGVTSFRYGSSARNKTAFNTRFQGSDATWIAVSRDEMSKIGIHSTGAFCTDTYTKIITHNTANPGSPLILCPSFGFLSSFRSAKGLSWPGGNEEYRIGLALHDDWASWCLSYISGSAFEPYRGNQNVLGFFSDNEIPFDANLLKNFLSITDPNDVAYKGAVAFMQSKGKTPSAGNVTTDLGNEFLGYVAEKYYKGVKDAVTKADPGLMYVGSRLHGRPKYLLPVVEACGKYCDIISINYYSRWSPELEDRVVEWDTYGKRPFLVTEFYTKAVDAEDSALNNKSGAGWLVPTQSDRAYEYQNFTLGLLEARNCVGWTWFKYQDDDGSDNSNCPANKGLYDNSYNMWPVLSEYMKEINYNVYDLIDYFDGNLK